jgi:RNA polymerase sigma-70 factor (ECF subfamily)
MKGSVMTSHAATTDASPRTEEAQLLRRLRQGDAAAYEQLVRAHGPRLMTLTRRFLRCEEDCNDAVQETFISAFASIDTFAGDSALSTWLHRIAVNVCLMKLRKNKRHPLASIEPLLPTFKSDGHHTSPVAPWKESADDSPFAAAVDSEQAQHIRACIDELPDSYRTVIMLRDIEELSTEETAQVLDCTVNNVKTRLHRARQALRRLLEPRYRMLK